MEKIIQIAMQIGEDLRIRSFFRNDVEKIIAKTDKTQTLDFKNVVFVSRSVADELCNILLDYPQMHVTGLEGNVKMMYDVVVRARTKPRVYNDIKANIVELQTKKDLEQFFENL